jgi:hypothetical protein
MTIKLNDKSFESMDPKQKVALESVLNKLKKYKIQAILELTIDGEWLHFDLQEIPDEPPGDGKPTRCGICYYYPLDSNDDHPCIKCCAWWDRTCLKYQPKSLGQCPTCKQKRVTMPPNCL